MKHLLEIGFEEGRREIVTCEDEARALAVLTLIIERCGGEAAWFRLKPDANGDRLTIRVRGDCPISVLRIEPATRVTQPALVPMPDNGSAIEHDSLAEDTKQ